MHDLIDCAIDNEARRLHLEVRPSNRGALALYRRLGFRLVGVRPRYYQALNGRENAWLMRCDL